MGLYEGRVGIGVENCNNGKAVQGGERGEPPD